VLHNLPVTPPPGPPSTGDTHGQDPGPPAPSAPVEGVWFPIDVAAVVTPAAATLTAAQKSTLTGAVEQAIQGFVGGLAVGETIVYNRLVAAIVAVDGVYDVSLDVYPHGAAAPGRRNLAPAPPDTRARLDSLDVTLRGALIALDVAVSLQREGLAATADPAAALGEARTDIVKRLDDLLRGPIGGEITPEVLRGALPDTDTYSVKSLDYKAEFVDEGLRITASNRPIEPADDQQPWLRSVAVTESVQVS
jgi:hypothetical protein